MINRILFAILLIVAGLPLAAQEKQDTTYLFRFVAGNDMFYSPWNGNGDELARLTECIEQNRAAIDSGQMYLLVTSYGTEGNQSQTATEVAHIRRNRVKSELITRMGIKEENFVTDQSYLEPYVADGESLRHVVVVFLPAPVVKVAELAGPEAAAAVEAYNCSLSNTAEVIEASTPEPVCEEPQKAVEEPIVQQEPEQTVETVETNTKNTPYTFAIRANLLRWATLTPDLGIEWRVSRSVGILVNSSYTSWCWNEKNRKYALWEVAPEVRYYLGGEKAWYIGAMFKAGSFNYKFSETGKQGDIIGGGITGGYQLKLNKSLLLDLGIGLGYLNADYDKYYVEDNARCRTGKGSKDWWGPISAGVSLVWTIF